MSGGPLTVGQLEARLRSLLPRLGKRDRQFVLDGIEAIHELATQLHRARTGHVIPGGDVSSSTIDFDAIKERKQAEESMMTSGVMEVVSSPLDPYALTPRSKGVLTDIQEPTEDLIRDTVDARGYEGKP